MDEQEQIVFSTTDPFNRVVTLKYDTWTSHIIGESGHNEVLTGQIKSNIESPRYILQNTKPSPDNREELIVDETRQDYIDIIPKDDRLFAIKTIVEFDDNDNGTVVTNYILRNIKEVKTSGGVIYDSKQSKNSTE